MPRFGLASLFFRSHHESLHPRHHHHRSPSSPSHHARSLTAPPSPSYHPRRPSSVSPSTSRQSFSASLMDENITLAESIIGKWDPSTNLDVRMTSLFRSDKREAALLLRAVADLQRAMLFFSSDELAGDPAARSRALVRAQALMQSAIRRLELELHLLLSSSPDPLDSVSARSSSSSGHDAFSDDEKVPAMDADEDLRAIADAMIAAGYGKEYARIYKTRRKSIVEEGLYRLGFEKLSPSQIQKLDWDILELKIKSWLRAAPPAINTLFSCERTLADNVFSGTDSILESCFVDVARDAATALLSFPDSVARTKPSLEKLFRILDLYDTISTLLPSIDALFSFDSTAGVRSQARISLLKLADTARALIADFESHIQKDASRSAVPGGGVHPLTRYVMNYMVFLGDYKLPLADIFADSSPEPEPEESSASSPMSKLIAWLVLVLLCKLDGKAEAFKHVAQSYLFLANNLQYIANKVGESELKAILGDEWLEELAAKARHHMGMYERFGWATVAAAIPSAAVTTAAEAEELMKSFNAAYEEAFRIQAEWVVVDKTAREEVRAAAVGMIVPAYRGFYCRCRELLAGSNAAVVVRYSPADVRDQIEELVSGSSGSGSSLSSDSGSGPKLLKLSFCWRTGADEK